MACARGARRARVRRAGGGPRRRRARRRRLRGARRLRVGARASPSARSRAVPASSCAATPTGPSSCSGLQGEPFLRIGPDGVAENRRSPTWAASRPGRPGRRQGCGLRQGCERGRRRRPDWRRVSTQRIVRWHDERARELPARAWSVPLEVDGTTPGIVRGTIVRAAPPRPAGGGPAPPRGRRHRCRQPCGRRRGPGGRSRPSRPWRAPSPWPGSSQVRGWPRRRRRASARNCWPGCGRCSRAWACSPRAALQALRRPAGGHRDRHRRRVPGGDDRVRRGGRVQQRQPRRPRLVPVGGRRRARAGGSACSSAAASAGTAHSPVTPQPQPSGN